MDISPHYIDARNAITQPDKMVFLSQYFRRSWMPALGPLGTAVVIYLRGACYHNRKSGETRDHGPDLPARDRRRVRLLRADHQARAGAQ